MAAGKFRVGEDIWERPGRNQTPERPTTRQPTTREPTTRHPNLDQLGTVSFVDGVGWKVLVSRHSDLRANDIIVKISKPDNPGVILNIDAVETKQLTTKAQLDAALNSHKRRKGGGYRVAIQFERPPEYGGLNFVEIQIP
jgi:hypothetical protein